MRIGSTADSQAAGSLRTSDLGGIVSKSLRETFSNGRPGRGIRSVNAVGSTTAPEFPRATRFYRQSNTPRKRKTMRRGEISGSRFCFVRPGRSNTESPLDEGGEIAGERLNFGPIGILVIL